MIGEKCCKMPFRFFAPARSFLPSAGLALRPCFFSSGVNSGWAFRPALGACTLSEENDALPYAIDAVRSNAIRTKEEGGGPLAI